MKVPMTKNKAAWHDLADIVGIFDKAAGKYIRKRAEYTPQNNITGCTNVHAMLQCAFLWRDAPQREKFWVDISKKLENIRDAI